MDYFTTFYLDKERDIVVNLYKTDVDELTYIIETPNHNTGNLITNLARICGLETTKNEKDMKNIKFAHDQIKDSLQNFEQENKSLKSQLQALKLRRKSIQMQM